MLIMGKLFVLGVADGGLGFLVIAQRKDEADGVGV